MTSVSNHGGASDLMHIRFTLHLPRDEASVPVVRHICRDALRCLGVARGCVDDIALAVTEACTNVLKHAAGTDDDYEVSVEVSDALCIIRVIDAGKGFDADAWPDEDAQYSAEGGRGIHLMRALVDDLKFVSKPESGTIVHLEKQLELQDGSILERLDVSRVSS